MIRSLFTGIAALALMSGAAIAQDDSYSRTTTTTTVTRPGDVPDAAPPSADDPRNDRDTDYRDQTHDRDGGVYVAPDPGVHAVKGAVKGATAGAIIGCIVTIPIGCAPGAAVGAAVGGGGGAVVGAATTPPPRVDYPPEDSRPDDR
jgi:hypothetical protein